MAELPPRSLASDHRGPAPADSADLVGTLRRVCAGDEVAFAALYDTTCQAAYGLALRVARDPELAARVTQAAYREVWHTAARHDSRGISPTAWILSVVHRQAVATMRSLPRHPAAPDDENNSPGTGPGIVGPAVVSLQEHRGRRGSTGLTRPHPEARSHLVEGLSRLCSLGAGRRPLGALPQTG